MSNEEYLNNMNVQYSPEENEDNYEHSDSNNPELNRGIITRFLDSKLDTYNDRISSLEEKIHFSMKKFREIKAKLINLTPELQNWKSKISFLNP